MINSNLPRKNAVRVLRGLWNALPESTTTTSMGVVEGMSGATTHMGKLAWIHSSAVKSHVGGTMEGITKVNISHFGVVVDLCP